MGNEMIALWTEMSSDPELIAGVRAGDTAAFGLLYERHADAARKVAAQYTNTPTDIDDVVSESFSRVLRALQQGDGPDLAFRAYLFTIVRRTGMDLINKGIRTKPRDDMSPYEAALGYQASSEEPAMEGFEHGLVADAFKSLPERWQAVLWYTEVEKKTPKEIAPLLGLSANGVAALSYRAREALRQAYLQQHLSSAIDVNCLQANAQLGAFVRGGLNRREATRVDEHVRVCQKCAALVAELEDVNRGMRSIIAPLILGALGVGALEGGLPIGGAFGTGAAAGGAATGGAATAGAGSGVGGGAVSAGGVAAGVGAAGAAALGAALTIGAAGPGASAAAAASAASVASAPWASVGVAAGGGAAAQGVTVAASGAATTGVAGGAATGSGMAGIFAGVGSLVIPIVAVAGVASLALAGASYLGVFGGDTPPVIDQAAPQVTQDVTGPTPQSDHSSPATIPAPSPTTSEPPVTEPAAVAPAVGAGNGNGTGGTGGNGTGGTGGTGGNGTGGTGGTGGNGTGGDGGTGTGTGTGGTGTGGDGGTGTGTGTGGGGTTAAAVLALAKAPLDFLEIPLSSPAVGMQVSNVGDAAASTLEATIVLPAGLTFSAPAGGAAPLMAVSSQKLSNFVGFALDGEFSSGDWTCTLSADAITADCKLPALAVGADTHLNLGLTIHDDLLAGHKLASDAVTSLTVVSGAQTVSYSVRTGLEVNEDGVDDTYSAEGHMAAIHVGATLMGCDTTKQTCRDVMGFPDNSGDGKYNNNGQDMRPLNEAGGVLNSASTTLTLPAGATVKYALLEWSANRSDGTDGDGVDPLSGAMDSARLRVPGASDYIDVTADSVKTISEGGREYYRSRLDITDLVAAAGSGEWSLADIALPNSRPLLDSDKTYYGGFAITLIYEDPTLANSRVAIFDGAQWVTSSQSADVQFATSSNANVTVGWTAWEADRALTGDSLEIDGSKFTPLRWNGASGSDGEATNAADSTAFGGKYANTLGVDAKLFKPRGIGGGVHTVTVGSSGDNYLLSTLTVTITDEVSGP